MAPRLQATDNKVVQIGTRKARGAGGAKRSNKPVNRLKPAAHEDKPPKPAPAPAAGDDQSAIDARARKSSVERLAALTNQHRVMDNKIDAVKLTVDELVGEKKLIRTAIKNIVRLDVFDERYEKLKLKTKRTDLNEIERERAICSEAMGLPMGEQEEMRFAALPEAAKPGVYWRSEGYKAGIAGEACDPVAAGCPPESIQEFNAGWGDGQAVVVSGMKQLEVKDTKAPGAKRGPKPKAALEPVAAEPVAETVLADTPDWADYDADPANWDASQRATFMAWYDGLDPDVDTDIEHPGIETAFDRLNDGAPAFR